MSVIALHPQTFRAVENKLSYFANCTYTDKEHNSDTARRVFGMSIFSGNSIYDIERLNDKIRQWITEAYRFNQLAYNYRYKVQEPVLEYEAGTAKKITLIECYKLLQCIIYNSDVDSYMEPADYEQQHKAEHEAWRETGRALLRFMASHIVEHLDDYQAASWSSL